jgi:hypothetical protein
MPRVSLVLSEQLSDLRSRRVIYNVTVENLGQRTLHLRSVSPRVGKHVSVSEVTTPADLAESDQVASLCGSVEDLLKDWLAATVVDDPTPPAWRRSRTVLGRWRDTVAEAVADLALFVPAVLLRILRALDQMVHLPAWAKPTKAEVDQRIERLVPPLYDYEAARHAVQRFTDPAPLGAPDDGTRPAALARPMRPEVAAAFDVRLDQLERLDKEHDRRDPFLVELPPDSQYTQTLELDFRRGLLNARKHTVTIEVRYAEIEDGAATGGTGPGTTIVPPRRTSRVATATEFLVISPNPVLLTVMTLAGAALGTLLQTAAGGAPGEPMDFAEPWSRITSNAGVTAAILALVFFNGFEFTSLAGRFTRHVNWRGALLIGVVCGLAGEKILGALNGLGAG